jgi:hypothetical protein
MRKLSNTKATIRVATKKEHPIRPFCTNNQRFRAETNRILEENYEHHTKIYTDGSKKEEDVGYAVIWEEQTIKRKIHPQNSIYRAEQSAIINATYSLWKKDGPKVIITDSLSTTMVVSDRKRTKNPKTQKIRKLMDE